MEHLPNKMRLQTGPSSKHSQWAIWCSCGEYEEAIDVPNEDQEDTISRHYYFQHLRLATAKEIKLTTPAHYGTYL